MPRNLTNKSPLFVKVHPMQKGFIVDKDLVGLGDDPNLKTDSISMADPSSISNSYHSYLRAIIFDCGPGKVLDGFPLE